MEKRKRYGDVFLFVFLIIALSVAINWLYALRHLTIPVSYAQFIVGLSAFIFQLLINQKPLIELYSKSHPYRRLKPYGVISAFIVFEFIVMWGLYKNVITSNSEYLFLITVVFIGMIGYYHAFVRMKISLRFLLLGIFIPLIAMGAALGLGSYFQILKFVVSTEGLGNTVFFNTLYWMLFNIFIQLVCEEPAFRGYLMQRLLDRGEMFAVLVSSIIFALWYLPFGIFSGMGKFYTLLIVLDNFIIGMICAVLFIKSRNLLVCALCHGIINGISNSLFASASQPGIRAYISFLKPQNEIKLTVLWFGCLFVGLVLLTFIPRKKLHAY